MAPETLNYGNFIDRLLEYVPEFKSVYDEHRRYYGEVLPHVLLADFTRFILDAYAKSIKSEHHSQSYHKIFDRGVDLMEHALESTDPKLRELVAVSFLENLDQAEDFYSEIRSLLGPRLKAQLLTYESD